MRGWNTGSVVVVLGMQVTLFSSNRANPLPLLLQVNGLSQALTARETQLAEQSALLKKVRGLYLRVICMLVPFCVCLLIFHTLAVVHCSHPHLTQHFPPQVAESKALQRDTITAQKELHAGQLRQLERLVEQVGGA